MNIRGSASNLVQANKELTLQWDRAKSYWRDTKSEQFAETWLKPLPDHIARARYAMEELGKLLSKVRSDCE